MKMSFAAPLKLSLSLLSLMAIAPFSFAAETPKKAAYLCETIVENSAYLTAYQELVDQNNDPEKSLEASMSSMILATDVIFPRAFPSKLQLSYDRDAKKVSATYLQLSTAETDGESDLLSDLLFREASTDPLEDSLWIDDFKPELLSLPEVRLFRDKLIQVGAGHGKMTLADFEKFSDAIVKAIQTKSPSPLKKVHFEEHTQKWAWGEAALDQRADTQLQRKEFGRFVMMRTGNYGVLKVQGAQDSLLSGHPARCKKDGEPK